MNLAIKLIGITMATLMGMIAFLWFGWPLAALMTFVGGAGSFVLSILFFVKNYLEQSKIDKMISEDNLRFENHLRTRIDTLPQPVEQSSHELAEEYAQDMINRHR